MEEISEKGIIFEKSYFNCILKQAANEGFIKVSRSHWLKFYERITPAKTKTALQILLLYGKIYYPDIYLNSPEEIWKVYGDVLKNELMEQDLFEITCRNTVFVQNEPLVSELINECMALKYILLSSRSRRRRCFDPDNFGFMRGRNSLEYYERKFDFTLLILALIAYQTETITTLLDRIQPYLEKHKYYKDNLKKFLLEICNCVEITEGQELLYSMFDNSLGQLFCAIRGILHEGQHLSSLLYFSNYRFSPVLADNIRIRKTAIKVLKQFEDRLSEGDYSRIALGVFFEPELRPVLPVVNSIKDVLRLREDRKIKDFRNKIFEWTMILKEGETNLSKIKREIIETNKKLKTIGKCERVSTWITFLSLPANIALTLSGLPISIVTSIVSFDVACASKLLNKDYNWYLFGVQ